MPETTAVTENVAAGTSEIENLIMQLTQQEWFPYAAAGAVIVLLLIVFLKNSGKPVEKCRCCECGGRVIGGVRMNDTEVWIQEAKFCPLCGRQLK